VNGDVRVSQPFTSNDPATTEAVRSLFQVSREKVVFTRVRDAIVRVVRQELRNRYPAIDNKSPVTWGGSEAAGYNGKYRISDDAYQHASGLLGHQHVPENDHWDPGHIDPRAIMCTTPNCG
jgi:hypothetical protein